MALFTHARIAHVMDSGYASSAGDIKMSCILSIIIGKNQEQSTKMKTKMRRKKLLIMVTLTEETRSHYRRLNRSRMMGRGIGQIDGSGR